MLRGHDSCSHAARQRDTLNTGALEMDAHIEICQRLETLSIILGRTLLPVSIAARVEHHLGKWVIHQDAAANYQARKSRKSFQPYRICNVDPPVARYRLSGPYRHHSHVFLIRKQKSYHLVSPLLLLCHTGADPEPSSGTLSGNSNLRFPAERGCGSLPCGCAWISLRKKGGMTTWDEMSKSNDKQWKSRASDGAPPKPMCPSC